MTNCVHSVMLWALFMLLHPLRQRDHHAAPGHVFKLLPGVEFHDAAVVGVQGRVLQGVFDSPASLERSGFTAGTSNCGTLGLGITNSKCRLTGSSATGHCTVAAAARAVSVMRSRQSLSSVRAMRLPDSTRAAPAGVIPPPRPILGADGKGDLRALRPRNPVHHKAQRVGFRYNGRILTN